MKLYNKLFVLPAVAALIAATVAGCSEEKTLSGADAVYIELTPSGAINIHLEDTARITAQVTNVNGDVINTPIRWEVDDASAIEIVEDTVPNSTLITCADGSQGKSTKLRAILENDQYAIANVNVVKAAPLGVNPVEEDGSLKPEKRAWRQLLDSVIFAVEPKQLLLDYEPECDFGGLTPYSGSDRPAGGVGVDKKHGQVIMYFEAPDIAADHKMTCKVGDGATAKTGTCTVKIIPPIEGATFYGPKYVDMPNIGTRPPQGTLSMWYAYTYDETMDVNDVDTVRVAFNVMTGLQHDIEQSYKSYHWEAVEGNSVMKVADKQEFVENHGFNAVLVVRSGMSTGTTVFHCVTPDTILVATFDVRDFVNDFPVNAITCSHQSITSKVGVMNEIEMGTDPMSSFGYHKPQPKVDDPTIVSVSEYNGRKLVVTGLKPGTTNIRFTSNQAPEFVLPVTIIDAVNSVRLELASGSMSHIFVGQTSTYNANVTLDSGTPNTQQVNFTSDNTGVASVANVAGNVNQCVVTGVSAGVTKIRATLEGKYDYSDLNVVGLPAGGNVDFSTSDFPPGYSDYGDGFYALDLIDYGLFLLPPSVFEAGTHNLASLNGEYELGSARAKIVAGTMTVVDGTDPDYPTKTISFNVTVRFADGIERTFTATDQLFEVWLE